MHISAHKPFPDAAKIIASRYPTLSSEDPRLYHPALRSLYSHFVAVVCDVCFPYTHNPYELQYIAAARWPGFVQPILEEHQAKLVDAGEDQSDNDIQPPSEDVRLRLTRLFSSTLSNGLEWLYPRRTNASDWARANAPPPDLLSNLPPGGKITPVNPSSILGTASLLSHLPRLSKFILVGSFLASTNPAKSDLRMFGRGLDDKKRKRKARATTGPKNGVTKVRRRSAIESLLTFSSTSRYLQRVPHLNWWLTSLVIGGATSRWTVPVPVG